MAADIPVASPKNDPIPPEIGEDAETRATRRELKQSSISDPPTTIGDEPNLHKAKTISNNHMSDRLSDVNDEDLKGQISSPKKKRAHDQLDVGEDSEENDVDSVVSSDSAKDRTARLEPKKKRHRDEDDKGQHTDSSAKAVYSVNDASTAKNSLVTKSAAKNTTTFAASSFGKLATGSSPFADISGSQKSVFSSSASPSKPSFTSTSALGSQPPAPPKLSFGGTTGASPFAGLTSNSNGFGTMVGKNVFGSTISPSNGLSSFASPGAKPLQGEKPARPFGAPESDEDEDDDADGDEDGDDLVYQNHEERDASPEKEADEKKKVKLHRVEVDDGETGEATLISVRAKMFHHDKEVGWKERGAGMLKINAPQTCVEFDECGAPIPGSFDASGLNIDKNGEHQSKGRKVVRLIMRQDQTHRVILNTALVPAMNFQEKTSLKSAGILFTAFEGDQATPVSVTMRMSAANAKIFLNEIGLVQRELQGN